MEEVSLKPKKGFFYFVEKAGNALPNPALLFGIFALTVLVLSAIGALWGWHGAHPATGERVDVVNLLSRDGIHRILLETVTSYTSFAPLGIVMVALLGIGVAESSGLIKAAISSMLAKSPAKAVTFIIIFAGLISNVASDLGYVLIIPLAGTIFHSMGRNPLAGMAAAFAAVSGGFSANIIISTQDPLLAGLSTEAARIIDPIYEVLPTANYYFMAASTFVVAIICWLVTVKWVEPRLGKYTGDVPREEITQPTALEQKGLRWAGFVFLAWFAIIAIGLIPENGVLRGADGTVLNSPVLRGFIALLFLMAAMAGAVYGFIVGKFKKAEDVILAMNDNIKTLASYLVLVFFAAQFVAWFRWSNLGLLLAINGAGFLQGADIHLIPLVIIFVIFTSTINLVMGSASAKWAIVGPVFVPIFMLLGYSPELSQAVYRVGDSITNIITPVLPYFALIIVFYQKYDKKAGIGTIIANMIPYTVALFIGWVALLILWIAFRMPLGPGAPMFYGV
ncbi:MAG: AbgT family transporter [Dysgonamonadaceae bacterium]|jgi:aminobenzoyl-glutamate transport protein|nr:AbgT family transporter [Dysgonamonadaceae bacterium]